MPEKKTSVDYSYVRPQMIYGVRINHTLKKTLPPVLFRKKKVTFWTGSIPNESRSGAGYLSGVLHAAF